MLENPPISQQKKGTSKRFFTLVAFALILGAIIAFILDATSGGVLRTNISGTITRDGKPLEWNSEGGHLLVLFVPENRRENQNPYLAETDRESGTFKIPEMLSGKYRVAVHQFDEHHQDSLGNKFDPNNTPLRSEVTEDGQIINVDIPKAAPKSGRGKR